MELLEPIQTSAEDDSIELHSTIPILHDIASPISSIEATFILLDDYKIEDKSFKRLLQRGVEAINLTKEILNSKEIILSRNSKEEFLPINSINKLESSLSNILVQNNITIRINMSNNIYLKGEPHVFERIILNILSNSIQSLKISAKKTKEITIKEKLLDDTYLLFIKDNGVGFEDKTKQGTGLKIIKGSLKSSFNARLRIHTKKGEYAELIIYFTNFFKKDLNL